MKDIKEKRKIFIFISLCIFMALSLTGVVSNASQHIPTTPYAVHRYYAENGYSAQDALFDPHNGDILFITKSTLAPSTSIRYRSIGYQFNVKIGGRDYWTVIPQRSSARGMTWSQDIIGNIDYSLVKMSFSKLQDLLQREFTGLSALDVKNLDINSIVIDPIYTIVEPNRTVEGDVKGGLYTNGTPYGFTYFTRQGNPSHPYSEKYSSSASMSTTYDRTKGGILGAAPWSSTARNEISARFGIRVKYLHNDLSATGVRMTNASGVGLAEYKKGENIYLEYQMSHVAGIHTIGRFPPVNPFGKINYRLSVGGSGSIETTRHLHGIGQGSQTSVWTERAGPFRIYQDSFTTTGIIDNVFRYRGLNRWEGNDAVSRTFYAKNEGDLSLSNIRLSGDSGTVYDGYIDANSNYDGYITMNHLDGQNTIVNPRILVEVRDNNGLILSRTSYAYSNLYPGSSVSLPIPQFTTRSSAITVTGTISGAHKDDNSETWNDTVSATYQLRPKDLSLTNMYLFDTDGSIVDEVVYESQYRATAYIRHLSGQDTIYNPVITTTVRDSKGNTLYNSNDTYYGYLYPGSTVAINTSYFYTRESDITVTSTIASSMDYYNNNRYNDTQSRFYKMKEQVSNNYFIKSLTPTDRNINLPNGSGGYRNITFNVDFGHEIEPYKSGAAYPNLVIRNGSGSAIWSGSVYVNNNSRTSQNITVNTYIGSGSNNFTAEINENRALPEMKRGMSNPYSDNKGYANVNAFSSNYGIEDMYVRTKWTKDTGKNDYPSQGIGWMKVGNGSTVKIKAGNGFETLVGTKFNHSGSGYYSSDSESLSIKVPFTTLSMQKTYDNGSGLNSVRRFEIPTRSPVGQMERKIYTRLDTGVGIYRVDISAGRTTNLWDYYTVTEDVYNAKGEVVGTKEVYYTYNWSIYNSDSDYFNLEILAQDDLKSHIMK